MKVWKEMIMNNMMMVILDDPNCLMVILILRLTVSNSKSKSRFGKK